MRKLTAKQFWLKAANWGSYMDAADRGKCMYGFNENGTVQSEAHREACLQWIAECQEWAAFSDIDELNAMAEYLRSARLAAHAA